MNWLVQPCSEIFCLVFLYLVLSCLAVVFGGVFLSERKMEEEGVDLLRGSGELEGGDGKETVVGMHCMRTEYILIKSKITSRSKKIKVKLQKYLSFICCISFHTEGK